MMLLSCAVPDVAAVVPDRLLPPPAGTFQMDAPGLADRLRLSATPLKWRELLGTDARITFIGDVPARREPRRYLAAVIGDIASAGITHLAVELPEVRQRDLDSFCSGRDREEVAGMLGETLGPASAAETLGLLRASCSAGLRLVKLDLDTMERRLREELTRDPGARVLAVLRRRHVSETAIERLGYSSRTYTFLTNGLEDSSGEPRVAEPEDRRYYLALDAAGLRSAALLLPCPSEIGATGCLALPAVLDEGP